MGYDVLLVGHFYQMSQLHRLIVNGSLKGYDEYAGAAGFPSSALGRRFGLPIPSMD
jgi:hypothetical protein